MFQLSNNPNVGWLEVYRSEANILPASRRGEGKPDARPYDAVLLVSFGGPEGPDDVLPFLENVTRGRGIPRERLASVAEHYLHFGGVSPINGINRELITQLQRETELPVYFGNRN